MRSHGEGDGLSQRAGKAKNSSHTQKKVYRVKTKRSEGTNSNLFRINLPLRTR